jgi:hypothetical protein
MEFPAKAELVNRYRKYTDDELMNILNHPDDYQAVAVEAAREVAEARGVEVTSASARTPKRKASIFPVFSSPVKALKLVKSLQRLFYFVALIPFITGALSFADGYPSLALVYGGIAILWVVLAFLAVRRKRHQMVLLMFLLLLFMLVTRYMTAGFPPAVQTVDWVVFGIVLVALVYLLACFKILIRDYLSKV